MPKKNKSLFFSWVLYPSRQEAYQHRSKYMKAEFLIAAHDMKNTKQADAVFFKLICSGVELIYNVVSFCCIAKGSSCTYIYVLLLFTHQVVSDSL